MVSEQNLILGVQTVAECLLKFAGDRNWNPNDFHVFFRLNLDADRFHMIFVGPDFDRKDYFEAFKLVWRSLYDQLGDGSNRTDLLSSLSLSLLGTNQMRLRGKFAIPPDYQEYPLSSASQFQWLHYPSS
jgi:hypothetical protein